MTCIEHPSRSSAGRMTSFCACTATVSISKDMAIMLIMKPLIFTNGSSFSLQASNISCICHFPWMAHCKLHTLSIPQEFLTRDRTALTCHSWVKSITVFGPKQSEPPRYISLVWFCQNNPGPRAKFYSSNLDQNNTGLRARSAVSNLTETIGASALEIVGLIQTKTIRASALDFLRLIWTKTIRTSTLDCVCLIRSWDNTAVKNRPLTTNPSE